ncbi:MAG TPA: hypothetical protein VIS06_14410 [Mycobacteriales bacterium]
MVAALGAVVLRITSGGVPHFAAESVCTVVGSGGGTGGDGDGDYRFSTVQAANAATITAVGQKRSLPDRAVVIALATAMQESKLVNLDYGDRDSLGLFQQRPSQGWGSPGQVRDPHYAAGKFYDALVRVPHWDTMPLTRAAQAVQQSGFPDEYAKWEPSASALAGALLGTVPAGLRCTFPAPTRPASSQVAVTTPALATATPRPAHTAEVVDALRRDYATVRAVGGAGDTVELTPANWVTASWLVANAEQLAVESVSFDGRTWTRSHGDRWTTDQHAHPDRVAITVAGDQ